MKRVKIAPKDWKKCDEASEGYWSQSKKGFFGRGIINSKDDPARVPRIGLLGELALSRFLKRPVNFEYVAQGEKSDIVLKDGRTIDIKTASRNYGAALIRCISKSGKVVLPREKMCDIYVAAYLEEEDRDSERASVILVGWLTADEVAALKPKPARVGDHKNWELEFDKLHPMDELK